MATLEYLEGLLADALQCLDEAAGQVRDLDEIETKPNLMRLGAAINEVWELREEIHKLRPDLKPPFVVEYEHNKLRYDQLAEIAQRAYALEEAGDFESAKVEFAQLQSSAVFGYYRTVAEAGLYRLSQPHAVGA